MTITLYHCVDARSFRALWALEEIGLAYTLEVLPFPPRYRARAYLDVNPLGTVPLLIDGEARMTESAMIGHYLAEKYAGPPLVVRAHEPGFAAYCNGLAFGEATLTFPQTIVLRYGRFEPPERRLPQAVADYARWTLGRLAGFEAMIAGAEYAAAGRFTMADVSIGYALLLTQFTGLFEEAPASLRSYFYRLAERPAFRRAREAQARAAREKGLPSAAEGA